MENTTFQMLFIRWCENKTTEAEDMELAYWFATGNPDKELSPLMKEHWQMLKFHDINVQEADSIKIADSILQETAFAENSPRIFHGVHFLKTTWLRWAAAIIILFGISTYIYLYTSKPDKEVAQTTPSPMSNDVMPGSYKAMLTLSDGKRVQLNNNATSESIKDGALSIKNSQGQLSYQHSDVVATNMMNTPRGGQYQLVLPDGSQVWLNAESSITFPTAFKGSTREVKITGEVYFEIKNDKEKPFIVKTAQANISVLGTAFNVNAYAEKKEKISLLSGSVKVAGLILKPGQAYLDGKVIETNLSQDIAWKNGRFDFNDLTAEEVMHQLARWYDVEFIIEADIRDVKFGGGLKRKLTLTQILRGLEGIGGLHFYLKNKTVIVKR